MSPFKSGALTAIQLNFWMVFASMIGFGSMAESVNLTVGIALGATLGIWGLPGQVAMIELFSMGTPFLAIVAASSLANLRFMPMLVIMLPLFQNSRKDHTLKIILAQLMSINIWSITMQKVPTLPTNERLPFYLGASFVCLTGGALGTIIGYFIAGELPTYLTLSLIFLNPAYFVFVISSARQRNCFIAVIIGAFLGPTIHTITPNWSAPLTGIIAGTVAFYLDRLFQAKKRANNA